MEHDVSEDVFLRLLAVVVDVDLALAVEDHRVLMDQRFGQAEFRHEFDDALRIEERRLARGLGALVFKIDGQSGVEEGQLLQAGGQAVELELDGVDENGRVREEGDRGPGALRIHLAHDVERLGRLATLEADGIHVAIPVNLRLEPIGQGVDALRADAMETAGILISPLAEFAAGVEIRQHQFDRRDAELRVHVDRNPAPVVRDRNRAIDVDRNLDPAAIAGEVLVDRVVENFENAMVETAFVWVADIHPGPLADGFQTLEFVNLGGVVCLLPADVRIGLFVLLVLFRHGPTKGLKCRPGRQGRLLEIGRFTEVDSAPSID